MAELPPHIQERVVCSITAAVKYEAPANIILAVAEKEGGGALGAQLERYVRCRPDVIQYHVSILPSQIWHYRKPCQAADCNAYDLATWRLRMHIKNDKGNLWTKAANYH